MGKKYLENLPKMKGTYPTYEQESTDMAITLALYQAGLPGGWFPEVLINSSVWAANSLILNSDMREKQIPIFFYIEDLVIDMCKPVFDAAGIPDSNVIVFSTPPAAEYITKMRISKGFYMFKHDVLKKYKTLVHFDTDLFLCLPKRDDPLVNIDILKPNNASGIATMWFSETADLKYQEKTWWWNKGGENLLENFNRHRKICNKFLPVSKSITPLTKFPSLSGGVQSFDMELLPQSFFDYIFEYEPLLGDEELLLYLWSRKHDYVYPCVINPCAWLWDHPTRPDSWAALRKVAHYVWSHKYEPPTPTKAQFDLWLEDIGATVCV